ncbi:CHAT domain-containing protein [Pontibacter sp. G13]|uniref:CHAT domain-containing protein n=1 Tax=Pontibacter sp. G13 TaxID=3074898 RepID=UPI0028894EB3|nr:CHAT domain-containing protein [Pontibacter sp. G13]WNJ21085.1 CHAT domain-containing protein [Pontibacter sp. G13]
MLASSRVPVVFLACVNSYRHGKRLRYLVHERKSIAKILQFDPNAPLYEPIQKGNLANQVFFKLLNKRTHASRVTGLHFTGHWDAHQFKLESDELETPITLKALSDLIGQLPNLKWVFLSGCANPALVELLLARDVPAVIVTQSNEKDPACRAIAQTFYQHLAQGRSIMDAFDKVASIHPEMLPISAQYDVEDNTFDWIGKTGMFSDMKMPWGLYYLPANQDRLLKPVETRRIIPFPVRNPKSNGWRTSVWANGLQWAAGVLALGLLAAGITMFLYPPF